MPKIRSQKLLEYLEKSGALNGTDADITVAKKEYRKIYNRELARERRKQKREIKPLFTPKQYQEIKLKAVRMGTNPTALLRMAVTALLNSTEPLPHKAYLLEVMQLITMANIYFSKHCPLPINGKEEHLTALEHLSKAELQLQEYISAH
jgi:hypothetical protein